MCAQFLKSLAGFIDFATSIIFLEEQELPTDISQPGNISL